MRYGILISALLALALVGCGKKEDAPADSGASPKASMAAAATPTSGGDNHEATTGDLKEKLVGDWTCESEQPTAKVEMNVSFKADGTCSNEGKVTSEQDQGQASMKMECSYKLAGKYTVEGDTISITPDNVETKIDNLELKAKDPAQQAAMDGQKDEMMKKAEAQMKEGMSKPNKIKVTKAEGDTLETEGDGGQKLTFKKKA